MRAFIAVIALMMAAAFAEAASLGTAIITQDRVALRASPRDSAKQQAQLWQGEMVEIRSERLDYLQVYDYGRERGGFVRANQVRRLTLTAEEAPAPARRRRRPRRRSAKARRPRNERRRRAKCGVGPEGQAPLASGG
ncbi:MAG TPA: hypothetical protein VHT22_07190, partial [Casimicrobiaceae bacterium]|nr:hypothetical protein [Casimicrobiaceae bacterium]